MTRKGNVWGHKELNDGHQHNLTTYNCHSFIISIYPLSPSGPWSLCRNTECGPGGEKTRDVWCSRRDPAVTTASQAGKSHISDVSVSDNKCMAHARPMETDKCFHVCDFHRYQYHWHIGEFSSCKARHGQAPCHENIGIRKRNVTCVAKCGGVAPSGSICQTFVPQPLTEEICEQECPRDCIVSDIGSWTTCETCWVRNATRYRTVVRAPSNGGQDCPGLTESRKCSKQVECDEYRHTNFQYKLGNWTECLPYHGTERRGSRGFTSVLGHRRRTVDCVKAKGNLVEKK
jgi:hypothetical protein